MKEYVYLSVMVALSTDKDKSTKEFENLAEVHVKNCIMDNPDADDCEVTDCDIRTINAECLAELYNGLSCTEKDKFLQLTGNE